MPGRAGYDGDRHGRRDRPSGMTGMGPPIGSGVTKKKKGWRDATLWSYSKRVGYGLFSYAANTHTAGKDMAVSRYFESCGRGIIRFIAAEVI